MTRRRLLIVFLLLLLCFHLLPLLALRALVNDDYYGPSLAQIPPVLRDGHRVTTGQPEHYRSRVLMFGNSALRGVSIADGETIASYLQALLPDVLVENYAENGAGLALELTLVQGISIQPGDTVVFYDGLDVLYPPYPRFPVCTIPLGIVQFPCQWNGLQYEDANTQISALSNARRWLTLARTYVQSKGATFVHVWQPIIDSQALTRDETNMMVRQLLWWRVYRDGEPLPPSADYLAAVESLDRDSISLIHVLDSLRRECSGYFMDSFHTTPKAHRVIAAALYEALFPVL